MVTSNMVRHHLHQSIRHCLPVLHLLLLLGPGPTTLHHLPHHRQVFQSTVPHQLHRTRHHTGNMDRKVQPSQLQLAPMAIPQMRTLDMDNMTSIANMGSTDSIINTGNTVNTGSTIRTASMITHNIMPHSQVLLMAMPPRLHHSHHPHLRKLHLLRRTRLHRTTKTITLFHHHPSFS